MLLEPKWAFFTGNVVQAEYREPSDKTHASNPFIEALPPFYSLDKAASLMKRSPRYDEEEERSKSALERVHAAQRVANCIVPLPDQLIMLQKFERMIVNGYMGRNPLSAAWVKQMRSAFPDMDWIGGYRGYAPIIRKTGKGVNCYGTTGVGKTTTIESVLSLFPQVIEHTCYNGEPFDQKQLVWLKLACPHDGSTKGLCLNFFLVSDAILETSESKKINYRTAARDLIPRMALRAAELGLGVLVVDEIQRLSKAASGGAEEMLDFFNDLTDLLGIPVVLVGTYNAMKLFSRTSGARRAAGDQGEVVMTNMRRDDCWDYFLKSIWKYQFTNVKTELTPLLSQTFYEESQGIADICIKLYMFSQYQVIGGQDERITPSVVSEAARTNLYSIRPILNALRRGNPEELKGLSDFYMPPDTLEQYRAKAEQRIVLSGALDVIKKSQGDMEDYVEPPEHKIAKLLVQAGYEDSIAIGCAGKAVARFAQEGDIKLATAEAFRLAAEDEAGKKNQPLPTPPTGKPSDSKTRAKVISLSGDLREIIKKAPKAMDPYQALKEAGMIKAADEFLKIC